MFVTLVQVLALLAAVQGAVVKPRNAIDNLQRQAMTALKGVTTDGSQKCTLSSAAVRKDWLVSS
jgi:hypothetical protein